MIKFFRHIRKSLIQENKMGKYFKYAIGEIILVVFGILIALQINNWNIKRLNRIEENVILRNLEKDLLVELKTIEVHKEGQEVWINSCTEILKHFDQNNGFKADDNLMQNINDLFIRYGYLPNLTTFSTLENTGKLDLIKNKALKDSITVYYLDLISFSGNTNNNNETLVDELINQNLLGLTFFQANAFSKKMKDAWPLTNNNSPEIKNPVLLKNTVQTKLNNADNALLLINAVNFRMLLAKIELDKVRELKSDTETLLETIRKALNNND